MVSERVASSDPGDSAPQPVGESDVGGEEDYESWPVVDDSAPADESSGPAAADGPYADGAPGGPGPGAAAGQAESLAGEGVERERHAGAEEAASRVYTQEEVSRMNSSWDQRIAALERQLGEERAARERLRSGGGPADTVQQAQRDAVAMRDELARQLIAQGFTESEAVEQANGQIGAYYRAWEASREAAASKAEGEAARRRARLESWNNERLNIAAQYGVPPSDLMEFATPQQMDKYAKAVSRGRPARRPQRAATGGMVPADTAPIDNERILDLYNAGLIDEGDALMARVNAVLDS